MRQNLPPAYKTYLRDRGISLFGKGDARLGWRAFLVGSGLSFLLAVGAPYGNMIIRGSYMALDFSTPGAIFLFLLLAGLLNTLFKLSAVRVAWAWGGAALAAGAWATVYWPPATIDPYAPGFLFSTFFVLCLAFNAFAAGKGGAGLALNRAELVLVYAMLLIVAALCTMGLSEQILPLLTALFYFASPQNHWREKLLPHMPSQGILVDDGDSNRAFYEGLEVGQTIPYGAWVEPLAWWGIFLGALYLTMIGVAVILRRQWMERERLSYPIAQIGLAIIRGEEGERALNGFFRRPSMWVGFGLPFLVGSLRALQRYDPSIPSIGLRWKLAFVGQQSLDLVVSFAMLGFSYMINAQIAAGIWFFHLVSKVQREMLVQIGMRADQKIVYGVNDNPFLAYQGVGALLAMVLFGLWLGREHFIGVGRRALGLRGGSDDSDEILSYRWAVAATVGGIGVMAAWLHIMGTALWVSLLFVICAVLVFIGVSRIVAEGGLAAVRSPMTAPDLLIQGLGANLIGGGGVLNLSLAYIWAADVRVFVMATCSNALKMIEEMEFRQRRLVFGAMVLALFIGSLGAFWMIFHMAYRHGGINLDSWFFKGAPAVALDNAVRQIGDSGVYWPGWGFFFGGGAAMGALTFIRQRLPWWPFHPIGFPIGANAMMDHVWFSVFLAWFIKRAVLRYGGAGLFQRSQAFFMGMIAGQVSCNGIWLCIDYFTGKVGNRIFWV